MTIQVRPARLNDRPAMRGLFLQSRVETLSWQAADAFRLADFDHQTQGELLWVAQENGQLVGFVALWEADHFIHHLFVDSRWHRKGIGRMLLRALPGWPATRFQLKCLCSNEAAQAFYRACGFVEIGTGVSQEGPYVLLESSGAD